MPNTFFRFREFTVHQEKTAMKVCTDACLFGAWVAAEFQNEKVTRALDIGTGTGLLSLMVAQKVACEIDAAEIDEHAYEQAAENFSASPWRERLHVHHMAIQDYKTTRKYDLVMSNPPFYERDLRSPDEKRNIALHGSRLGFDELFSSIKNNLKDDGKTALLIPFERERAFEEALIKYGFSIAKKVQVRQSVKHGFFRVIYLLTKDSARKDFVCEEIAIKDAFNQYTMEFSKLLADYYL